jgi:DNA-binding winged helix-turn-helix (wHTH) protein
MSTTCRCRGANSESFDRAINSQISRLRRKLGGEAALEIIRTIRNGGYIFAPEVSCIEARSEAIRLDPAELRLILNNRLFPRMRIALCASSFSPLSVPVPP